MRKKTSRIAIVIVSLFIFALIVIGFGLQNSQSMTVKGIPVSILVKGLSDQDALNLYLSGDKKGFHDRLEEIGIKDEIKAFYRPKIRDEQQLDQHIHQIFYNLSGYVGVAYSVNQKGILVLKSASASEFNHWYQLAVEAGMVVSSEQKNGNYYVTTPKGMKVSYQEFAAIYSTSDLEKLVAIVHQ
jgi:hypothetical protein